MQVSDDAIRLEHNGQSYFFCGKSCLKKFADKNDISQDKVKKALSGKKKKFYKNKTLIVTAVLLVLIGFSYFLPFLQTFRHSLLMYFSKIWWAIALGIFLGGLIDRYVPNEYISHVLTARKKRTIIYSVIIGFFMSFCSHGILALSIQLYKKGASNFSIIAFLLASPWANLAVTLMLFGFFGIKALFILVSAIVIALITGFIFMVFEKKNIIEQNKNSVETDRDFSIIKDIKKRFKEYEFTKSSAKQDIKGIWQGMVSLSNMVLWWILIGMGMASLAGAYVPEEFFQNYMGSGIFGLSVTLIFATIIEVCSEGSAPIAFEIFKQTGAIGNSFVFLMAGVATDYTEIGLLWNNVSKKVAILLPIVTVPQIIVVAYFANILMPATGN